MKILGKMGGRTLSTCPDTEEAVSLGERCYPLGKCSLQANPFLFTRTVYRGIRLNSPDASREPGPGVA